MTVGAKIKLARERKGLTQEELGVIIGVQKSAIAKYENGRIQNIKRSTLKKLADALEIRPSELIIDDATEEDYFRDYNIEEYINSLLDKKIYESITKNQKGGEMVFKYNQLSEESQQKLLDYMELLLKAEKIE